MDVRKSGLSICFIREIFIAVPKALKKHRKVLL